MAARKATYIDVEIDPKRLARLLSENPGIPLVVLVKEESTNDEYPYTAAGKCFAEVGYYLNAQQPFNDGFVYTDSDDFEHDLAEYLFSEHEDMDEEELEELLQNELIDYGSYWKKAILLWVWN